MISRTAEEDEYRSPWWLNRMLCWWDEWWWKEEIGARRTNLIPFSSVLEPSRACVPHRHRPEYQIKTEPWPSKPRYRVPLPPTNTNTLQGTSHVPAEARESLSKWFEPLPKSISVALGADYFNPLPRRKIVYSNKVYTNPRNSPH